MYEAHEIEVATQADRDIDEAREGVTFEPLFIDEDLIHSYPRSQAITDGQLRDVTAIAKRCGFKCPVAITAAAWAEFVTVERLPVRERRGTLPRFPIAMVEDEDERMARRVRGWHRRRELAARAVESARERRRVRCLLHSLTAAGQARASVIVSTEIGPIAVKVVAPDRFEVFGFTDAGEQVELIAVAGPGDEGELVATVMTELDQ